MVLLVSLFGLLMSHNAQAFYNSSVGRWPSRDPIGEPGFKLSIFGKEVAHDEANTYCFVGNYPVGQIDAFGLMQIPPPAGTIPDYPSGNLGDGKICGNYCGGGYCGGKRLNVGEKCDYNVPAKDALDSCCKTHDKCYDDVAAGKTTKAACDAALCRCSKIARLYRRNCDSCGAISLTTVPIWACYLTGR